jgi:D-alanyl-D-alanine carboxypeptidase
LAEAAFRDYPAIAEATRQAEYTFDIRGSGREHTIRNSNKLISEGGETFAGSKTGYLYEARYCLVVRGAGTEENRVAVTLGSPSEGENLADTKQLLHLP